MSDHIVNVPVDDEIPLLDQTPLVKEATIVEEREKREQGRKVDHPIEIKETNGQDRSRLQTNKSINQIFDEMFDDLDNSSIKSCTIFKVYVGLRESNPEAYTPKMVSLGPYHKKNPQLRSMEKYKLSYLRRFLKRKEGLEVESCIRELEKLKDKALKCYDEIDTDIVDRFSEMLLRDGSFVVEYIRDRCGMRPEGADIFIPSTCIDYQILCDFLLLENQLPFFVLTMLHDMTMDQDENPFTEMVKETFNHLLPNMNPAFVLKSEGNAKKIKHLLQLVHMLCCPLERKTNPTNNPSVEIEHFRKSLCWNLLQTIKKKHKPKDKDRLTQKWPNATELCEAGVRFSKVGSIYASLKEDSFRDSISLFDIKFENGVMEIPCVQLHDGTETILRNIIAYEQHSYNVEPKYFSDYATFMDHLIDSDKDVTLLRDLVRGGQRSS